MKIPTAISQNFEITQHIALIQGARQVSTSGSLSVAYMCESERQRDGLYNGGSVGS